MSSARSNSSLVSEIRRDLELWSCGRADHIQQLAPVVSLALESLDRANNAGDLALERVSRQSCRSGWCLLGHGAHKTTIGRGDLPLVVKLAAADNSQSLQSERDSMRQMCGLAGPAAGVLIPWTSSPFVVGSGTAPNHGTRLLLQQRLPRQEDGWFRVRDGMTFVDALLHYQPTGVTKRPSGPDTRAAALRTFESLLSWESLLSSRALYVPDLQFVRGAEGELWLLDAMEVERVHSSTASLPRGLRRPEDASGGSGNGGSMCNTYRATRQWAMLLSFAMLSALLSVGDPKSLEDAMCTHASCDLGCALVALPSSARETIARLSAAAAAAVARFDALVGGDSNGSHVATIEGGSSTTAHSRVAVEAEDGQRERAARRGAGCGPCKFGDELAATTCYIAGGEGFFAHELALQCLVEGSSRGNCATRRSRCAASPLCTSRARQVMSMGSRSKPEWMRAVYGDPRGASTLRYDIAQSSSDEENVSGRRRGSRDTSRRSVRIVLDGPCQAGDV